jgi:hypothetical protein
LLPPLFDLLANCPEKHVTHAKERKQKRPVERREREQNENDNMGALE